MFGKPGDREQGQGNKAAPQVSLNSVHDPVNLNFVNQQ